MKKNRFKDYQERLLLKLQNNEFATEYLNEALHDEDPRIFLLALKNVITAPKKTLSTVSNITRMNTHRILSSTGNPKWTNIKSLLESAGLHLSVHSSNHR